MLLSLSAPGGGLALGPPSTAVLTILNDDAVLQFGSAGVAVAEGGAVTLSVMRTGSTLGTVSVQYATGNESAAAPADYGARAGVLTFGPGVTAQTISVPTVNDVLVEGSETFGVTLSAPAPSGSATLGALSTATVTINDNDAPGVLRFGAAGVSVREGLGATLTVSRTVGSAGAVTVQYATGDGSAVAGADYAPRSGTLTFANGVVTQTLVVPTLQDAALEGAETFTVTLTSPTGGATLEAPATATVTVVDDEQPRIQFAAASANASVGETAAAVVLTVTRVGPLPAENTVQYVLDGVTATAGADFNATGGSVTFTPGQTSRTIVVPIVADTDNEPPETFTVTLVNPTNGAALGTPAAAMVTIVDNDPAGTVQFSAFGYAAAEGDAAVVTVIRSGGTSGPVSVQYATSNGTAAAGSDYTATAGTITFAAGETVKTFTVATQADAVAEGNQFLIVTLSAPTDGLALGTVTTAAVWVVEVE